MATDSINLKINVDASQAQQSTTSYRTKLKELKEQMVELLVETNELANATDEQKKTFAELEKEAGSLADTIGDVSARINANADDYQNFNAALEGLKGGAAVAQGLVGTLDLLGMSNSSVGQVVKTLMSLQGIMNSLNAVQQLFNKDSKVRIVLQKLLSTEVKKTAKAEGQATVAAGVLAAGNGVATETSFTLAGACKAVGVAIKSIPVIGWILAAIAALVSLVSLVAGLLDDGEEGLEQQRQANEQLELQKKHYEEVDSKLIQCKDDFDRWNGILATANKDSQTYKDTLKQLEDELGVSLHNNQVDTKTLNKLEAIHLEVKRTQLEAEFEQNQYLADRNKLQQINNVLTAAATLDYKERAAYIQDQLGVEENMAAEYAAAINHAADEHRSISDQLVLEGNAASKVYTEINNRIDEHKAKQKELSDNVIAAVAEQDKFIEKAGLQRINTDNKVTNDHNKNAKTIEKEQEEHLAKLVKANENAAEKIKGYWKTYYSNIEKENADIEKENAKTYEGRLANILREYKKTTDTLDKELVDYEKYYNSLSDKDKKALGDKLVTVEQFEAAQQGLREQALKNYTNAVIKEDADEAKRKIDSQNNIDNAVLATRLANAQEGSEEYFEIQKEIEKENYEQEMVELRRRLDAKQITQEEYDAIAKQKEAEHQNTVNDIRLASVKEGSEEYFNLQKQIEEERYNREMEELRRRLDDKQITQDEYDELAKQKKAEHDATVEQMDAEHQERLDQKHKEATQKKLDTEAAYLQKINGMLQYASDFTMALQSAELEAAEGNETKQKEIKKKYATANAVMQIAQIGIQTALGAMSAYQAMSGIPYVGPILGPIAAAIVVATGAANIAKAVAAKNNIMKAAKGAYVVGPSHSAGGVDYELEGGEMVLNKNVAKVPQFRAIASAMNVATGGVALGGVTNQTQSFGITKEDVQSIVTETVAGIAAIPVVVSANTITETQRRVNVTQTRSQI